MKRVFSFSLFGSAEKYWHGLLVNIDVIQKNFPGWEVYVWYGGGTPDDIVSKIKEIPIVKLIPTNETGLINMSYRFFSIDDPEVEVAIIRDADSRVYERDRMCIQEFVNSNKLFHIIRDHPNHHHRIMGGMWGIKKGLLHKKLQDIFIEWRQTNTATEFWNDMDFLRDIFYPAVIPVAMIHDELQNFEVNQIKTPFPYPLDDGKKHFIGQIYHFDDKQNEMPMCPYRKG